MKLNLVETVLVNNPLRAGLLRSTVHWLYEAACAPRLERVLEVGCGNGAGLHFIDRRFQPAALDGFDLDEKQVARARLRLGELARRRPLRLWTGDALQLAAASGTYDGVFEFAIFHHIPDWRRALAEVHRVLRPGGYFLFEELSREFFHDTGPLGALLRRTTVHPWEEMFDFPSFRHELAEVGLKLIALRAHAVPGWNCGVAVRQ